MTKPEPRIAIVGAGPGGISCAIALKQKYGYKNFTIYEKMDDVGGTWRSNIYPGSSSDVSMPFYCLSSELRNWKASHLPQPELLAYWVELAKKHDLYPHIIFNQVVESVEWNNEQNLYDFVLTDTVTKTRTETTAHIFISAVGILERPRFPGITGLGRFKRDLFHSGEWDYSKKLSGKRVGIIGNGSSAAQFIPMILKDPTVEVVQFCRTRSWMIPSLKKSYSGFRRTLFSWFPFLMKVSRLVHFYQYEALYALVFSNFATRWLVALALRTYMKRMAPVKYHEKIIPNYVLGCKRLVTDAGYLESLHSPNIKLDYDGIETIIEDGIMTKAGNYVPLDTLILATGYIADSYPISLKGKTKKTIQDYFKEAKGPVAYLGTTVPNFPNFFWIYGPNINTGHTSVIWTNEVQVNYILQLIQPIIEGAVKTVEVNEADADAYDAMIQARLSNSVYNHCNSWYRIGGSGKIINAFPGSSRTLYKWLRKPNWKHYSGAGLDTWLKAQPRSGLLTPAVLLTVAAGLSAVYMYGLFDLADTVPTVKGWIELLSSYFPGFGHL